MWKWKCSLYIYMVTFNEFIFNAFQNAIPNILPYQESYLSNSKEGSGYEQSDTCGKTFYFTSFEI